MSLVTPNYSIPYLTPGDRMTQIPVVDKAKAERLESLLATANVPPGNPNLNSVLARLNKLEAANADTGWVNCSLEAGVSLQGGTRPQVRKVGNFITLRWGISGSGLSSNTHQTVANLPSGFAPTDNHKYFQIASSVSGSAGRLSVGTTGSLGLHTNSSTGSYYIFDGCSWYID